MSVINILEANDVMGHIEFLGSYLKDGYNEIAQSYGIDTKSIGYPNRTMHLFPSAEHKSLFWQECIKRGVLFGYATFICASHTQEDIDYTLSVAKDALKVVKDNWSNPKKALKGKVASEVFRLVAAR
jgi:glutamate-1-semialdehyde 2,1-aminomutase/spore coat polysaccharide biosynthesis protein SpsF